jgi:hypothetical protein
MEAKQKNIAISHGGRALDKLRAYLQQAQDVASASVLVRVSVGVAQVNNKTRGYSNYKTSCHQRRKKYTEL